MFQLLFFDTTFQPASQDIFIGKRIRTSPEALDFTGVSRLVLIIGYWHTCASLLLANGVPMEQVKEWLGHSEISTTVDIYGHLQYATKKQSAAAIEQDIVAPMLQNLSAVSP